VTEPADRTSTLAERAARAIEAMTPGADAPGTDRYVADLVNAAAARLHADGRLRAAPRVCECWVQDLRTGRTGGRRGRGEESDRLAAFAEALGIPVAYLVRGDQDVASTLELLIHMKGIVRLVPFAQQVTRLPAAKRRKIMRAIDAAEAADLAAGHIPLLSPHAVRAMSLVHHEVGDAMRAGATASSGSGPGIVAALH